MADKGRVRAPVSQAGFDPREQSGGELSIERKYPYNRLNSAPKLIQETSGRREAYNQ